MPPLFIKFPEKIKNGAASRPKLSMPENIFCPLVNKTISTGSVDRRVIIEASNIPIDIGMPANSNIANVPKSNIAE